MYILFIPAALSLLAIVALTIKDQIGSKPDLPMLDQIEALKSPVPCEVEIEAMRRMVATQGH